MVTVEKTGRTLTKMIRGEMFGDPLTLKAIPRDSFYKAEEPSTLLCFDKQSAVEMVQQLTDTELRSRIQFLQQLTVPVFASDTTAQLELLAPGMYRRRFGSKFVMTREKEAGIQMFFLVHGECRVVREVMFPGSHPREVKLLDLARLYSGEYFGEMALLGLDADALWHKQDGVPLRQRQKTAKMMQKLEAYRERERLKQEQPWADGHAHGASAVFLHGTRRSKAQHSFNLLDDDDDISSDDSVESEVPQENAVPADIGTRQATVFSTGPVEVLVLPRDVFYKYTTDHCKTRMKEYAKGYPTSQEIRSHYLKANEWIEEKKKVVHEYCVK
jgi:CRP-like cAMP-binding protein|mmetsp:Transcript_30238/g.51120  ORF Transcript_30238/g.51120 Transcript_30238/m.51120 type:complete len:329 (-) Transcript_30238:194-1180(-)